METTNDNLIDKQLYISMQQGNKKAFDTLFIKYYAMLCAFARSFVSLEDAEEVVQDTMLQIWENRKTNHIDSSVHHYLFKASQRRQPRTCGRCCLSACGCRNKYCVHAAFQGPEKRQCGHGAGV